MVEFRCLNVCLKANLALVSELDGEEHCQEFPVKIEFDKPYRIAIEFDRDNNAVAFRLEGFSHTEVIESGLFDAFEPSGNVQLNASDGGYVLGYIDDVRTSSTALTACIQHWYGARSPAEGFEVFS